MTPAGLPALYAMWSHQRLQAEYAAARRDPGQAGVALSHLEEIRRRRLDTEVAS